MRKINRLLFILFFLSAACAFADPVKVYIEYEFSNNSTQNKMIIKLYKDGDNYKLVRKLSDSPSETGIVTTYVDITANSVISVTEKDGVKKGIKAAWDDDYFGLIMQYPVLFRGIPKGKSFKNYIKSAGTESVNGRDCDIYESGLSVLGAGTKYYMWDNIMLRSIAPGSKTESTNIDENPVFSEAEFSVPLDVEF